MTLSRLTSSWIFPLALKIIIPLRVCCTCTSGCPQGASLLFEEMDDIRFRFRHLFLHKCLKQTRMASASSSSGSAPNAPRKYDVFVSFRGEDTRNNFTGHLHAALNRSFLVAFRDDKLLEKGDEIAPSLSEAIKDSNVYIVVFSKDYASSRWCLDELAQIMQHRKHEGQFVIPIFYKVDPSHVRNIRGTYKDAFEEHETKHDHDKVSRWKAALSEAANLGGRHCQTSTDESNLIEEIVADVSTKLKRIHNYQGTLKDAIGIDEMIEPIEELLENFHKVGIWGMGGVGKTTMAKAVFTKLSYRYDSCCFLKNIREKTERNGSEHVRDYLVSELLRQDMQSNTSNALTDAFVARRLGSKKALVVLDDVDSYKQLEDLQCRICNFLGEGSKVIVTTRNRKLLRENGYEIHEAKGLSYDNSVRLFIRKAFRSDHPDDGYEKLIQGFVDYTQHNPLALEVLGSFVRSEDKKLWGGLLRKLREGNPNDEILKVLRLSYDGLEFKEKQIFLDIACFLKGESEEFVEELLESYEFYPAVGIQTLKDKALIVTAGGKVQMHDLIQEMGYQIVREESVKEPGNRSRLWDQNEIHDVLKYCEGEKEVEGIMFNTCGMRPLKLTAKTFNKMTRIRFLKVHNHLFSNLRIPTDLESISTKIRYFHWDGYPGKSLPSNFCAELLLELNMEGSWIETLWNGVQELVNLRRLNLRDCRYLRELPDFSKACRLESVDLSGCSGLRYVHASLLSLHSLISLDVRGCNSLESLRSKIHLKSLKQVKLSSWLASCPNLKKFSVSSEELTSLDLSDTKIKKLSPSIGRCSKLRTLCLVDTSLKNLPAEVFSRLTSLEKLRVEPLKINSVGLDVLFGHLCSLRSLNLECSNLNELPDSISELSNLEELYLRKWSNLTKLPDNMRHLSKLQFLSVKGCFSLRSLPELPPSLRILIAAGCTSLKTVSTSTVSSTHDNYGDKIFSFINCYKLDLGAIKEQAKRLLEKAVHEKEDVTVFYPGWEVPKWFGDNRTQKTSDTLQLSLSLDNLVGFVFCAVVDSFSERHYISNEFSVSVEEEEMFPKEVFPFFMTLGIDNVVLRSNPKLSESLLEKIEGNRRNHEATATIYNRNLLSKFCVRITHSDTKKCGVCPIYASEYSESNFYSRKPKGVMI